MDIDLQTMLTNLSETFPFLTRMFTAVGYLIGIFFAVSAMFKLKQYGEMRTMQASNTDFRGPLVMFLVAIVFLYLPGMFNAFTETAFGSTNPLRWQSFGVSAEWQDFTNVIIKFVQLIGLVAFMRGLLLMSHLGGQGAQHGTMGKGMMHIIGGILGINIESTASILRSTLGLSA